MILWFFVCFVWDVGLFWSREVVVRLYVKAF